MIILDLITNHPFIAGIASSFIASALFIFSLLFFGGPKIKISKQISHYPDHENPNEFCYRFKIVNDSYIKATDINFELNKLIPIAAGGNSSNLGFQKLHLTVDKLYTIPPKTAKENKFAVQVRCREDLRKILKEQAAFVRFEIHARNGLTGISSSFTTDFCDEFTIVDRPFPSGKSLLIV